MANIISSLQRVNEAEITAALEWENRSGEKMTQALQADRLRKAARESSTHDRNKTAGSLGKIALTVPAAEFFRLRLNYGDDCWNDKGFIKDYQRLVPGSKVAQV